MHNNKQQIKDVNQSIKKINWINWIKTQKWIKTQNLESMNVSTSMNGLKSTNR